MKRGFTLLELLVVIIIISILASLGLPQYLRVAEKAKQTEGVRALGAVRGAQLRYYARMAAFAACTAATGVNDGACPLDITTKNKYFTAIIALNPLAADTPLARAARNTTEAGSNSYTLYIYKDGTISYSALDKTDKAPSATRPGL